MKKLLSMLLVVILCITLTSCTGSKWTRPTASVIDDNKSTSVKIMYARDFLGLSKAQISKYLGDVELEEYYNGGNIYKFQNSEIWLSFGAGVVSFDVIEDSQKCTFAMASLSDAAEFSKEKLTKQDISNALQFDFEGPVFDEHDESFIYSATKNNISCTVSCSDDGYVSLFDDYIIYIVRE